MLKAIAKSWFRLAPLVLAIALFCGCNGNLAEGTVEKKSGSDQGLPEVMSDSDLENTIRARLISDDLLKDAILKVTADAGRNQVTLSGIVETEAMRDRAIEVARSTGLGVSVRDKIKIIGPKELRSESKQPSGKKPREASEISGSSSEPPIPSLDDSSIYTIIMAGLTADPSRSGINVDVKNGVVTLRGSVESAAEKIEVERIAAETEDVKRVVNQLRIEHISEKRLGAECVR